MRRLLVALVALSIGLIAPTMPAAAIVYGTPDGDGHPSVGALIAETPNGDLFAICTGTLIASKRFVTAAHCIDAINGEGLELYGVTFDSVINSDSTIVRASSAVVYPNHTGATDVAVVFLSGSAGVTPASLPKVGALKALAPKKTGKPGGKLTIVGYGVTAVVGHKLSDGDNRIVRMRGETQVIGLDTRALGSNLVMTSAGNGTGGGTCYGDSGGPFFISGTTTLVAITVTGSNPNCGGNDISLRIDSEQILSWIQRQL